MTLVTTEVELSKLPISCFVLIGASSGAPFKAMETVVEDIGKRYGVKTVCIDVQYSPWILDVIGKDSPLPVTALFREGKIVSRVHGVHSLASMIRQLIK